MNTRISYHYADKRNCKQYVAVVVAGIITWEQIAPYLATQRTFIPGQIGLEDLQYRFALPGGDHPWHQIGPRDFRPTTAEPTIAMTAEELAERFSSTRWDANWMAGLRVPKSTPVERAVPRNSAGATLAADVADASDTRQLRMPAVSTRTRKLSARAKDTE